MKLFQSRIYQPFTPRVETLSGKKIISRSGALLPIEKWTFRTLYKHPIVILKTLGISLFSIRKRGVVDLEPDRSYGFIHSIWTAGYYHWLTESLPRALVMREKFPHAVPMLPKGNYENYTQSLIALGFEEVCLFPDGKNVCATDPVVTECPKAFATTEPALLRKIRERVLKHAGVWEQSAPTRLVYVSRSKARGRFVINEADVIRVLREFGADIVNFEDYDFLGQVRLMSETHTLISIHGAALTNMMFMPAGGNVIELIPKKNSVFDYRYVRNSLRHDPCYLRLSDGMGHAYHYLQCKPRIKFHQGTHMADIWVDPARLRSLLAGFL